MANSKYAYVRNFELPDPLLPGCFLVCRIDGHSFHRFSEEHGFAKPNDERALKLMDHAAKDLMSEYKDIVLGFGESDEFSFLLRKSTHLYNRRHAKILTMLTSYFTSCYVFHWPQYFPENPLRYPPSFDGRIVLYPDERATRDYFSWRQADTHINNLYNTVFWALVQQGGQTTTEAHATLRGTVSSQKHEILFKRFHVNYNDIPARFRKGSVVVCEVVRCVCPGLGFLCEPQVSQDAAVGDATQPELPAVQVAGSARKSSKAREADRVKTTIQVLHCDVIGDEFWNAR
ncbi:tRNAHis guanylyltransferase-domain-containing protein, partial [Melanogaster broomeanus]